MVIVDDGLATGATARTAVHIARARGARRIILAVPVAPSETVKELQADADQVVSLVTPPHFVAVGLWYRDFEQTSDEEVAALLRQNASGIADPALGLDLDREVTIPIDGAELEGLLQVPAGARGIVLFAHGSGSSRLSPRNLAVARAFHERGLGTLLFDLLTPAEASDRRNVFDVELLGSRLLEASDWIRRQGQIGQLPRGYFGASTGAAAALWAAGSPGNTVRAVVSRGGRPDLADARLPLVRCPTLLIVGGADRDVLELNRMAATHLYCQCQLAVVPGCDPPVRRARGARGSGSVVRRMVREVPAGNEHARVGLTAGTSSDRDLRDPQHVMGENGGISAIVGIVDMVARSTLVLRRFEGDRDFPGQWCFPGGQAHLVRRPTRPLCAKPGRRPGSPFNGWSFWVGVSRLAPPAGST